MKKLEAILAAALAVLPQQHRETPTTTELSDYLTNVHAIRVAANYRDIREGFPSRHVVPLIHGTATVYTSGEGESKLFTNYHIVDSEVREASRTHIETQKPPWLLFRNYTFTLVDNYRDDNPHDDIHLNVIAEDKENDMAYLRADRELEYTPFVLGDSDRLKVGDRTYLIGMHESLGRFASDGLVASLEPLPGSQSDDYIVTNKANSGVSGGPLFAEQDGLLKLLGVFHQYIAFPERFSVIVPVNKLKEHLNES